MEKSVEEKLKSILANNRMQPKIKNVIQNIYNFCVELYSMEPIFRDAALLEYNSINHFCTEMGGGFVTVKYHLKDMFPDLYEQLKEKGEITRRTIGKNYGARIHVDRDPGAFMSVEQCFKVQELYAEGVRNIQKIIILAGLNNTQRVIDRLPGYLKRLEETPPLGYLGGFKSLFGRDRL